MPDTPISSLTEDTAPSLSDYFETLDVSDTSMSANGSNKKVKGTYAPFVRTLFAQSADVTVVSTTTETTLIGSGVGSVTLPAGFLTVGRTIRITGRGYYSVSSSGHQCRLKLGSTTLLDCGNANWSGFTTAPVEFEALITCRSVGGTGTVQVQGWITRGDGNITGFRRYNWFSSNAAVTAAVTVDTTGALAINLTDQPNVSAAATTMTLTHLVIEALN